MAHLFRRWRRRDDDPLLLPALMLLCGVGLMTMCALRDPIRDTIVRSCSPSAPRSDRSLGRRLRSRLRGIAAAARRAAPLGIACGLAVLLLLFGSGPGSSGVKVNLFGVQPVEGNPVAGRVSRWPRTSAAASRCCASCRSPRRRRGRG
jgi:hypothetical protein